MALFEPFTFYQTEKRVNDAVISDAIENLEERDLPKMFFRAPYVPPYSESSLVKTFQRRSAYRPFHDEARRQKIAVIYLSEWIGHEKEEHLEKFIKFLYDYHAFFHFTYYFVAERTTKEEARDMYKLLTEYLGEGRTAKYKKKTVCEKEGN